MSVGVWGLIIGVVAITYVIVSWRRQQIERAYERGDTYRKFFTVIVAILVAWTFIRSGDPWLMAAAVLGIAFATIYVIIEQPHKELV